MKRILAMVLTAVMVASLAACGNTASKTETTAETTAETAAAAETATGGSYKIGMSWMSTSDAVIAQCIQLAQEEATAKGAELLISDAENDASKQLDAVENFIQSGCDAIIIQAIDATSMSEEAKKAMDQGIKVIAYGIGLDNCDVWYKNDNTVTGTAIGEMAAEWINANLNGSAKVCVIGYSMMDVLVERADAIEAALKANCAGAEVVARFDAIDSETGMSSTESMLAAHPDVNVICSISDGPAVGAYEAVKANSLDSDKFGIFGSDLSTVALGYINDGTCYRGTTDVDNLSSGKLSVDMACQLIDGEAVDDVVTMGCKKVTADNLADYSSLITK